MRVRHLASYAVFGMALLCTPLFFVDGCDLSPPPDTCNSAGGYCSSILAPPCGPAYETDSRFTCDDLLSSCCMPRDCTDAGGACIPSSSCTSGNTSTFRCGVRGDVCCFPATDGGSTVIADAQPASTDAPNDGPDGGVDGADASVDAGPE
ncbi:MAG: hypothetical protein ACRENE_26480 [Polyangiaceae bacterium]